MSLIPFLSPPVTCPKCNSTDFYRSRRRTTFEQRLAKFSIIPFRCRNCQLRFFRRVPTTTATAETFDE